MIGKHDAEAVAIGVSFSDTLHQDFPPSHEELFEEAQLSMWLDGECDALRARPVSDAV